MRLIDIEKLRGCAIIRPHDELEVKVIESFSDKVKHQDIPTAYDADKVVERIEQLRMQYIMTIANTGDKTLDVAYGFSKEINQKMKRGFIQRKNQ